MPVNYGRNPQENPQLQSDETRNEFDDRLNKKTPRRGGGWIEVAILVVVVIAIALFILLY